MDITFILQRKPTIITIRGLTTFGEMLLGTSVFCRTLEDAIRSHKIFGETCFDPGLYELRFRDSPHFGPETIEIVGVPHYTDTLIHAGTDNKSTLGCVIVGDTIDMSEGTISGGKLHGVLEGLKSVLRGAFEAEGRVWLDVRNPSGPD